jgi:plasmid maintenance system killer protein
MKTATEISRSTTIAQFMGVADNAAITEMVKSDKHSALYKAIEGDKDLTTKMEELQAKSNDLLEPQPVIDLIGQHLKDIKAKLPNETVDTTTSANGFLFAKGTKTPLQNEKRFVLSQLRTWGEVKFTRDGSSSYKSVTVDGYYLIETPEGTEIVSGQFISNTSLFKSIVTDIDLSVENQAIDLTDKNLAFMVRTEEWEAKVTTYNETRSEAISEAKKAKFPVLMNPTTGEEYVVCHHRTSNKAVFRGLGAKINSVLSQKLEAMALGLLDAKAKAQQEAQSKRVDNQLEIEKSAAETKNLNEKVSGLLETLTNNSDKLQTLGINAQALLLAALTGKVAE